MPFFVELALLAGAGFVAGAINVVAGGGSFLTLPLLLFLGLPAGVANATNRVGVLAQNVGGLWGFHRYGMLPWRWATSASMPAMVGAALGAWLSLRVPDVAFTRLLSFAMLGITLWTLWHDRSKHDRANHGGSKRGGSNHGGSKHGGSKRVGVALGAGFFLAGVYGGFVQAGVGFFLLALTTAAGLDLVRGNAVKLLAVLMMAVLSLAIFAGAGTVDWVRGGALAGGNLLGGLTGVGLAVLKGHRWLERVVTVTVVLFALLLLAT